MLSHWFLSISPAEQGSPQYGGVQADVFANLRHRFPKLVSQSGAIEIRGGSDEQELEHWLEELAQCGVRVPRDKSETPSEVVIYKYQVWNDADIANAPLLEPGSLAVEIAEAQRAPGERGAEWILKKNARLAKNRAKEFGSLSAYPNMILVRGGIKRQLELAGLKRLFLKPMEIEGSQWPVGVEPLYLMWSDLELPPVANMLFDNKGNVFPSRGNRGPFSHGCLVLDGHYTNAQLRYHKTDLSKIEDFDIGYTYERFGNREPCWPTPIVSQRFRVVCEELNLRMKWVPVGLEN